MKNPFSQLTENFHFPVKNRPDGTREVLRINLERFIYLIYIGLPVAVIHIIIFSFWKNDQNQVVSQWKSGIILSHSILLIVFLFFGLLIPYLRKKKLSHLPVARFSPHIIFQFLLLMGALISGFDQLVTNSITPFLIVCLLASLILIIPPLFSAIYFLFAYIAFYFLITHFQIKPEVLQSNYVNGITSILIGWLLSITFWKINVAKYLRNNLILKQQAELSNQNSQLKTIANELTIANKTKDKLISIISHDLRSPFANLTSILNLFQCESISEKDFRNMIPELYRQTVSTNDLLENLLNWSGSKLRGARFRPETINIRQLSEEAIKLYHFQIIEKKLNIINNFSNEHLAIGDPGMIALVLRNLISNAIKFTGEKGLITLTSFSEKSYIKLEIRDNGVGIPHTKMPMLFSEENNSTKGTAGEKGTGLGLMLCKEFVEKNKGELSVKSEPGNGSCFAFTLPATDNFRMALDEN